jgi:hypothetical protein
MFHRRRRSSYQPCSSLLALLSILKVAINGQLIPAPLLPILLYRFPGPTSRNAVGHPWQGRRPPLPFRFPFLLSLSLFKFELGLTPSPLHSKRTYTHTRAPIPPAPPPLHLTATDAVGEVLLGLYLFFLRRDHIPHATLIVQENRHRIVQRLELLFPPTGVPPEPPPTLITVVTNLHCRNLFLANKLVSSVSW